MISWPFQFLTPKLPSQIRIPKLEIRNKPKHSNFEIQKSKCETCLFEILCAFLSFGFVSDFEFRVFLHFSLPWRPLRLCASHSGSFRLCRFRSIPGHTPLSQAGLIFVL